MVLKEVIHRMQKERADLKAKQKEMEWDLNLQLARCTRKENHYNLYV